MDELFWYCLEDMNLNYTIYRILENEEFILKLRCINYHNDVIQLYDKYCRDDYKSILKLFSLNEEDYLPAFRYMSILNAAEGEFYKEGVYAFPHIREKWREHSQEIKVHIHTEGVENGVVPYPFEGESKAEYMRRIQSFAEATFDSGRKVKRFWGDIDRETQWLFDNARGMSYFEMSDKYGKSPAEIGKAVQRARHTRGLRRTTGRPRKVDKKEAKK